MSKTVKKSVWYNMPTIQSKEILTALIDAKQHQKAMMLISDTGLGKTNTIKMFVEKNPDNTYVLTVGDSYKQDDVVNELCHIIGIEVVKATERYIPLRANLMAIGKRLHELGEKGALPLIIIDEAENVKNSTLKTLKELYDAIIDCCGIVLIGTDQLLDNIMNRKRKNRTSVPQLHRRFKAGTRMITPFKKARDMQPFFDKFIPNENAIQDLLLRLCDNYGELHDFLHPVILLADKKGEPISEKMFRLYHNISN